MIDFVHVEPICGCNIGAEYMRDEDPQGWWAIIIDLFIIRIIFQNLGE